MLGAEEWPEAASPLISYTQGQKVVALWCCRDMKYRCRV